MTFGIAARQPPRCRLLYVCSKMQAKNCEKKTYELQVDVDFAPLGALSGPKAPDPDLVHSCGHEMRLDVL